MQTNIHERFRSEPGIAEADSILRSCVHCGFCNATCPTYLALGDERDGPRGRIYLIKQLLEGDTVSSTSQRHLDRCLTCLNCETTCPSGVRYGALLDIGRGIIEREVPRGLRDRLLRAVLKRTVPYRNRFGAMLSLGRLFARLLPKALRAKIPRRQTEGAWPSARHARRMLALEGCAQAAATPRTNAAAARVLDRLGISLVASKAAGCCGAMSYHIGDHEDGLRHARRNIDAWWHTIETGAEAIAVTASGCGAFVKDYGRLLARDPVYAAKAARVSAETRDLSEVLSAEDLTPLGAMADAGRIAAHCPCTLQHAQKQPQLLFKLLGRLGFELAPTDKAHLCCGSAGAYSLLEPGLSAQLRDEKIASLTIGSPDTIVTANVGCQLHLGAGTGIPVKHWIELLDRE